MAKPKAATVSETREPLKCDRTPDEALRLAMLVPVPDTWKPKTRKKKRAA